MHSETMNGTTTAGIVLEPNPTIRQHRELERSRKLGWREVIPGLLSEAQIGVLVGAPEVGKTRLMAHLTVSLVRGLTWLGHQLEARPVAYFNLFCEPHFEENLVTIAAHRSVTPPQIPQEVEEHVLKLEGSAAKRRAFLLDAVQGVLGRKPNALVVVDSIDGGWQGAKLEDLYIEVRRQLSQDNRQAAALFLYDTRPTKGARQFDLAKAPHDWLDAQVPSSYVLNRPDLRLGMDRRGQHVRVLGGFKREVGEVDPIWLRSVESDPGEWAGFKRCAPVTGRTAFRQR